MRTPSNMKKLSRTRQARKALANAETRAAQHEDPAAQAATLRRGIATAKRWLDGTHPRLSE